MSRLIIILLFFCLAIKSEGQAPSLSFFTPPQQLQIKKYVKYVVDSTGAQIKKDYTFQDYLRSKRIDSLSTALKLTNDTLTQVRYAMVKPNLIDFTVRDTILIWNNDNFYVNSNGQILRRK